LEKARELAYSDHFRKEIARKSVGCRASAGAVEGRGAMRARQKNAAAATPEHGATAAAVKSGI
jgi:hypothetical protein